MYEIVPGLYLSNYPDAQKVPYDFFVVNCTADLPLVRSKYSTRISVNDDLRQESTDRMTHALPYIVRYIDDYVKKGVPVLVHCAAGQQRSAAVVAAYLMKTKGMTVDEAVAYVKSKKPDAFTPAVNFRESLESLQAGT